MTLGAAVAGLVFPVLLGVLCGVLRLFAEPERAVDVLNRFALYVPFPALVAVSLARDHGALPRAPAFWLVVPVTVMLAVAPLKWVGDKLGGIGGSLALVTVFGNTAYLGLPFVQAVRGDTAMSAAGILVGEYIFVSMLAGPLLLRAWSGRGGAEAWRESRRKVLRSPLAWSPLVGLALRAAPEVLRGPAVAALEPLGHAAGPVALFLLGLYLHGHSARVRRLDGGLVAHLVVKQVWLPLVSVIGVLACRPIGLDVESARVVILLASMPPAITTFAIARDAGIASDQVAQAIVAGSLLSAISLPITAAWVAGWGG